MEPQAADYLSEMFVLWFQQINDLGNKIWEYLRQARELLRRHAPNHTADNLRGVLERFTASSGGAYQNSGAPMTFG